MTCRQPSAVQKHCEKRMCINCIFNWLCEHVHEEKINLDTTCIKKFEQIVGFQKYIEREIAKIIEQVPIGAFKNGKVTDHISEINDVILKLGRLFSIKAIRESNINLKGQIRTPLTIEETKQLKLKNTGEWID